MEAVLTKITPTFRFRDEWLGNPTQHHLLLEITPFTFRFCVMDIASQRCVWLEEYLLTNKTKEESLLHQLQQIFSQHETLQLSFWKSVSVTIQNQSFTLIPKTMFRRQYMPRYLQLARGAALKAEEEAHYQLHEASKAVNVFAVERALVDWLLDVYPFQEVQLLHQTSVLIDKALRDNQEKELSVWFEAGAFTAVLATHGRLMYCNRFTFQNTSDLVYYILFILQELGLEASEIIVRLYGDIEPESELFTELQKYLSYLRFGSDLVPKGLETIAKLTSVHRYSSLMEIFSMSR